MITDLTLCDECATRIMDRFIAAGLIDMMSTGPEEAKRKLKEVQATQLLTPENFEPMTGAQMTLIMLAQQIMELGREDVSGCPLCLLEHTTWLDRIVGGIIIDARVILKHGPTKLVEGRLPRNLKP